MLIFFILTINLNSQNMEIEIKQEDSYLTRNSEIDDSYFKEKMKNGESNPYINLMYSYYLIGKDNINEAEKIINEVEIDNKSTFPQSLRLMNEGLIALKKGNSKLAEEKLRASLNADTSKVNKWVRLELFRLLNSKVDFEAWGFLESALELDPEFNQAKIEKSYQLDEDSNCREVIRLLSSIPDSFKDSDAQNLLGVSLINCGEFEKAKKAFEKSISYKSTSDNNFSLAQLMHEYYRELDNAENLYIKSLEIDPSNLDALNGYAWLLFDKNNMGDAEAKLLSMLEFSEEQDIYNQIINFYFLTNRPEEALKYINQSESMHGINHVTDGYKIILQIYRKEKYESLIQDFKKHYSQEEVEWLKNQIVFFFGEE